MATVVNVNGMSTYQHSPAPPIPARLHHVRVSRPATALGHRDPDVVSGYLAPVTARRDVDDRPPIPPRQPLRRSLSLTHRTPPQPGTDVPDRQGRPVVDTAIHEPTLDEVLASLRQSRLDSAHPAPLSPALSAPLLGQVVPVTRWPLSSSVTGHPSSPVRVVPLNRWPFSDTAAVSGRLTMDDMVVDRAGTTVARNEYVEGPSAVIGHVDLAGSVGRRRRVGRKTGTAPAAVTVSSSAVELPQGDVTDSPRRRRGSGFAVKVRRLLSCVGTSPSSSVNSSSGDERDGGLPRCVGGCGRCEECTATEQSSTLHRARQATDIVSCMCCVRFIFYHGLRDGAGDEQDCSDEPCACSDRPHCAARWAVMVALLPCLPCLCLYLPLRCAVDAACRRPCHCGTHRSRHPGLKALLESESSST